MFLEKGNTTMFEYTYGEIPASIIEPPLNIKVDEDESNKQSSVDANVLRFFVIFITKVEIVIISSILNRSLISVT